MKMKKFLSLLVTLVLGFTTLAGSWSAAEEAADGAAEAGQADGKDAGEKK